MAEFTYIELRNERETRKIVRWKVAVEIGVSTDTLGRWESGDVKPDPDDVYKLEKFYKCPGMWHKWMMSNYDSYREKYTNAPDTENLSAVLANAKFKIKDILAKSDAMERDAIDGKIDNEQLKKEYLEDVSEGMAALQKAKEIIPGN